MIPRTTIDLTTLAEQQRSSKTFAIDFTARCIGGKIDGLEAVRQAAQLILMTERYEYSIHSWNYGVELGNLIGKPIDIALSSAEHRITEALLTDERILSVGEFKYTMQVGSVVIEFVVRTKYGNFNAQKEVIL